jgi:hypothetical protein
MATPAGNGPSKESGGSTTSPTATTMATQGNGQQSPTQAAGRPSTEALVLAAREVLRAAEHPDPEALVEQWLRGVKVAHVGHTRAATVFSRRGRVIGVAATFVTTVVGTTLFSTLSSSPDPRLVAFAALASIAAVILSALQTFLNYGELVSGHRAAASAYGDLRRRLEQLLVFADATHIRTKMPEIGAAWTKLEQDSPDLPSGLYQYGLKWVTKNGIWGSPQAA